MGLGILAKKKNVSEMFKYLQMRFEIKAVTRGEANLKKEDHKLIAKAFKKYDLELIEKMQQKINDTTEATTKAGYKLAMNNFILLRVLVTNLEELKDQTLKIYKKTKSKEIFRLNADVSTDLKIIQGYLQRSQKQLFDLQRRIRDKGGFALMAKELAFLDISVWNYFKMRSEAKGMTKNISKLVSHKEKIEKLFTKMIKQGITTKEHKIMIASIKNLVKEGKTSAEKAYKLFTNLNLLLNVVAGLILKELKLDHEAIKKHIIPQAMGETDMKTKNKIINHVEEELANELQVVQQVWRAAA